MIKRFQRHSLLDMNLWKNQTQSRHQPWQPKPLNRALDFITRLQTITRNISWKSKSSIINEVVKVNGVSSRHENSFSSSWHIFLWKVKYNISIVIKIDNLMQYKRLCSKREIIIYFNQLLSIYFNRMQYSYDKYFFAIRFEFMFIDNVAIQRSIW